MEDELERAIAEEKAAYQAYFEANSRLARARSAVAAAKLNQSGIGGHLVEINRIRGWGTNKKTITKRFVVHRIVGNGEFARAEGTVVKKDGSLGVATAWGYLSALRDIGPYTGQK